MMCPDENCVWNQLHKTGENVCAFSECVIVKRNRVYIELLNLKQKPYLTIEERAQLANLNLKWERLMMCGDMVRQNA